MRKIRILLLENLRVNPSRGTNYRTPTVILFEIVHHFPNFRAYRVVVLEERNIRVDVASRCNHGGITADEG